MPDETSQTGPGQPAVTEVLLALARRPGDRIFKRWNWKSALLSSFLRGTIFFSVNLFGSLGAALSALATEILFRPVVSGFCGGVIESFRRAQPPWAATLVVVIFVPSVNHLIEFTVHWARGTERLGAGVLTSVSFSVLSGLFNIFAMRRGVLIVGDGRRPLLEDLQSMPATIGAFLLAVPRLAWSFAFARRSRAVQNRCGR